MTASNTPLFHRPEEWEAAQKAAYAQLELYVQKGYVLPAQNNSKLVQTLASDIVRAAVLAAQDAQAGVVGDIKDYLQNV